MSKKKYHFVLRIIHWLTALVIFGLIALGWYMADLPPGADPNRSLYYTLHKSFGVLVLFLFLIRVIIRFSTYIPSLPHSMPICERKLSAIVHFLLYVLLLVVPLSGYIMSDAGGHSVPFFTMTMPDLFADNKTLARWAHDFHHYAPYVLLGFVTLHVLGALKHRFFDIPYHNVLKRMWFGK